MKTILLLLLSMIMLPSCNKENVDNAIVEPPTNMNTNILIVVGGSTFRATLENNAAANAFRTLLPLTIDMVEMNGNEKYCNLPNSLPTASVRPATIHNGDIMLFGSRTLVLFYETFSTSYSYTRIGHIDNPAVLKAALGTGSITIKFEPE